MEGRQIVALKMRVRFSSITPYGQVCIAAIAADCKSATLAVNIVGSIPTLPTNNNLRQFLSGDIWRIRLIGQDKRLSTCKCRVRTPHPSPAPIISVQSICSTWNILVA